MTTIRTTILTLCLLTAGLTISACHQEEDDLFTTAVLTLQAGDGITVERVQGTVTLTNLNTRQVVTAADFTGNTAQVQVLRGVYAVLVEGSIQYRDSSGTTAVRQFRCAADYLALEQAHQNTATLDIVWL